MCKYTCTQRGTYSDGDSALERGLCKHGTKETPSRALLLLHGTMPWSATDMYHGPVFGSRRASQVIKCMYKRKLIEDSSKMEESPRGKHHQLARGGQPERYWCVLPPGPTDLSRQNSGSEPECEDTHDCDAVIGEGCISVRNESYRHAGWLLSDSCRHRSHWRNWRVVCSGLARVVIQQSHRARVVIRRAGLATRRYQHARIDIPPTVQPVSALRMYSHIRSCGLIDSAAVSVRGLIPKLRTDAYTNTISMSSPGYLGRTIHRSALHYRSL